MQYGAEVLTYQRAKEKVQDKNKEISISPIRVILYFVAALFISRVIMINNMAPFGLAFIIAVMNHKEEKIPLAVGCGALIGYLSLYYRLENTPLYLTMVFTVTIYGYMTEKVSSKRSKIAVLYFVLFMEMITYRFFIDKLSLGINLFSTFFQIACIFPIYYIMDYAITCSNDIKTKHLFTNEEIISMAIVGSLVISGTWGIAIKGISLTNILALAFVIIIGYVNGCSTGAATGVAMGLIVGIASKNITMFIGVYGVCGLMCGLFKETGKWISGLAYIIVFSLLKLYGSNGEEFKVIEGLITFLIFLAIPQGIYHKLSMELDWEKKQEITNESYIYKIKNILTERLSNFSEVLTNMSNILNTLVDNDKLLIKTKSSALIENLADRVCSSCDMKSICWKREMHYTYASFSELIQNYQESRTKIPAEIERKCVKRTSLIKNTEEIVNNYIISEMWRNRLSEGRQILASQINNMASTIEEIVEDFSADISINNEMERNIRRVLNKSNIKISDLLCYDDRNKRLVIKLSLEACGGRQRCVKEILPLINESTKKVMCISDEGCVINPDTKICSVTFEESPKYHMASYVARVCKDGEQYNGDSYSFGKLKDGTYMTIISDGMGSGPQAGEESRAAVELIEKFTSAGFSKLTAINTVNSIMTLKFSENEKFSTLDLNTVDLYSGDIGFMKVGAVESFIKRGDKVEIIKSKTLPIGVLDKVDIEIIEKKVKNGDIVVTVSDGVLDCCNDYNNEWLSKYLAATDCNNPKELVYDILDKAKEISGGKIKDDMTIVVSKVYSLY